MQALNVTPFRGKIKSSVEHADNLIRNGYLPIPVCGKRPLIDYWQRSDPTLARFQRQQEAHPDHTNIGLLTGELVGIDIDLWNHDHALAVRAIVEKHLGVTPLVRVGQKGFMLCYRNPSPIGKITLPASLPGDDRGHRVEVLGTGQQFVAYGSHPDTGKPYQWTGGEEWSEPTPFDTPLSELPEATPDRIRGAIELIRAWLLANGYMVGQPGTGTSRTDGTYGKRVGDPSVTGDRPEDIAAFRHWLAGWIKQHGPVIEGQGSDDITATRLVPTAFDLGLTVETTVGPLQESTGFDAEWLEKKARSGMASCTGDWGRLQRGGKTDWSVWEKTAEAEALSRLSDDELLDHMKRVAAGRLEGITHAANRAEAAKVTDTLAKARQAIRSNPGDTLALARLHWASDPAVAKYAGVAPSAGKGLRLPDFWDDSRIWRRSPDGNVILASGQYGTHKTGVVATRVLLALIADPSLHAVMAVGEKDYELLTLRLPAMCLGLGKTPEYFDEQLRITKVCPALASREECRNFVAAHADFAPGLFTIDTMAKATLTVKESDNLEVNQVMENLRWITLCWPGSTGVGIMHSGKGEDNPFRGAAAFLQAAQCASSMKFDREGGIVEEWAHKVDSAPQEFPWYWNTKMVMVDDSEQQVVAWIPRDQQARHARKAKARNEGLVWHQEVRDVLMAHKACDLANSVDYRTLALWLMAARHGPVEGMPDPETLTMLRLLEQKIDRTSAPEDGANEKKAHLRGLYRTISWPVGALTGKLAKRFWCPLADDGQGVPF